MTELCAICDQEMLAGDFINHLIRHVEEKKEYKSELYMIMIIHQLMRLNEK